MTAAYYVRAFNMQPHPEGGYFAETYRSAETIPEAALPERFAGARPFSTAIYFLLESHHVSALHRIASDEVWHFYAGGALEIFVITPTGDLTIIRLGNNPEKGEVFQAVVPAGCWFGSKPAESTAAESTAAESTAAESTAAESTAAESTAAESTAGTAFALVGCTVAPGFDFADFEMASRAQLLTEFPQHKEVIEKLAKPELR